MRYLITISYDGTDFSGYQKQPKQRTVQSELEKALNIMKDTWQRQNNTDDNLTNFIYNCNSLDEIIKNKIC